MGGRCGDLNGPSTDDDQTGDTGVILTALAWLQAGGLVLLFWQGVWGLLGWTLAAGAIITAWLAWIWWHPLYPCRYCDKGKTWDGDHEFYGHWCPGIGLWALRWGACDGSGEKWRPGVYTLYALRLGTVEDRPP